MVNQVIVPVDNRNISKELYGAVVGTPYIQDFVKAGQFFNLNYGRISDLIARYYVISLSGTLQQYMPEINARINDIFGNEFAALFPFMNDIERDHTKQVFLGCLQAAYDRRRTEAMDVRWDQCDLVQLSLDSYVVRCIQFAPVIGLQQGGALHGVLAA